MRLCECKSLEKGCSRTKWQFLGDFRPAQHCMALELILKSFLCVNPSMWTLLIPSFLSYGLERYQKTYRNNGRGKKQLLKGKKAKQSKKHKLHLIPFQAAACLPFALPAFGFMYLVPPANPIWCRRLWGGFDILRIPAVFSNLPHIHHCWHHGVNGGQVCSVQTVWGTWWYLIAV